MRRDRIDWACPVTIYTRPPLRVRLARWLRGVLDWVLGLPREDQALLIIAVGTAMLSLAGGIE